MVRVARIDIGGDFELGSEKRAKTLRRNRRMSHVQAKVHGGFLGLNHLRMILWKTGTHLFRIMLGVEGPMLNGATPMEVNPFEGHDRSRRWAQAKRDHTIFAKGRKSAR